ncbi:MAG TPA: hypothetical protein VJJ75_00180 [Candidatus Nanoarchaeia archaeon]|nr:hypothetical protein [Candidatus Nanoarchaeia archaeon]
MDNEELEMQIIRIQDPTPEALAQAAQAGENFLYNADPACRAMINREKTRSLRDMQKSLCTLEYQLEEEQSAISLLKINHQLKEYVISLAAMESLFKDSNELQGRLQRIYQAVCHQYFMVYETFLDKSRQFEILE